MLYNLFKDFVAACKDKPETVEPKYDARRDAREIYKLDTEEALLKFIGDGGLGDPQHYEEIEWRYKPKRIKGPRFVNDYSCSIQRGPQCYIAIIKNGDNWIIKSFKEDDGRKKKKIHSSPAKLDQPGDE